MKFYDREEEQELLENIREASLQESQMTVLFGRRRIGKTQLALQCTAGNLTLYFFVARKAETLLCQDFVEEAENKLGLPIGGYVSFAKLFRHLLIISRERPFNLIIDEFQDFQRTNPSIFSEIQREWDLNKGASRMNLIVSGSIYSLMHQIFEDRKEPLFSRAGQMIHLKPFKVEVLKEILADHNPSYHPDDLLALYSFTGGVAWYVNLFMTNKAYTKDKMIGLLARPNSPFLNEGKNLLIEEFGPDYSIYFSILECIAGGDYTRGEIENRLGKAEIGGYLAKLEKYYSLISKKRPIFSKENSKQVRYCIADNFLTFWFRFIYRYQGYIESGALKLVENIIRRDYDAFSGSMLERYFRDKFMQSGLYTDIGMYWNRKGENEIDLITLNDLDKTAAIYEIKRDEPRYSITKLEEKVTSLLEAEKELKKYSLDLGKLSLRDM